MPLTVEDGLGELRDRSFEAQRHRASGLNLVVAAIILWNTVISSARSGHFANKGAKSMKAYSSTSHRSIGITLTSQAITPGARTNASRRAASDHSGFRRSLSVLYFPFRQTTPFTVFLVLRLSPDRCRCPAPSGLHP